MPRSSRWRSRNRTGRAAIPGASSAAGNEAGGRCRRSRQGPRWLMTSAPQAIAMSMEPKRTSPRSGGWPAAPIPHWVSIVVAPGRSWCPSTARRCGRGCRPARRLRDAAADQLLHFLGLDARFLDHGALRYGQQVRGWKPNRSPMTGLPVDGGTQGFNDPASRMMTPSSGWAAARAERNENTTRPARVRQGAES